jgi:hypothetical protein
MFDQLLYGFGVISNKSFPDPKLQKHVLIITSNSFIAELLYLGF